MQHAATLQKQLANPICLPLPFLYSCCWARTEGGCLLCSVAVQRPVQVHYAIHTKTGIPFTCRYI